MNKITQISLELPHCPGCNGETELYGGNCDIAQCLVCGRTFEFIPKILKIEEKMKFRDEDAKYINYKYGTSLGNGFWQCSCDKANIWPHSVMLCEKCFTTR